MERGNEKENWKVQRVVQSPKSMHQKWCWRMCWDLTNVAYFRARDEKPHGEGLKSLSLWVGNNWPFYLYFWKAYGKLHQPIWVLGSFYLTSNGYIHWIGFKPAFVENEIGEWGPLVVCCWALLVGSVHLPLNISFEMHMVLDLPYQFVAHSNSISSITCYKMFYNMFFNFFFVICYINNIIKFLLINTLLTCLNNFSFHSGLVT